jgi:acetyl esterase/lipase
LQSLADRGVAAFVLKYRLNQTPADMAGFQRAMAEMFLATARRPVPPADPAVAYAPQIADARADEWRVDRNRIGMLGFSAGAMLTLAATLYGQDAKDDPFFANSGYGLIDSWRNARRPVEFHLFEQGGHGFGMYPKTTTSTGWFGSYVRWLKMHGYLHTKR